MMIENYGIESWIELRLFLYFLKGDYIMKNKVCKFMYWDYETGERVLCYPDGTEERIPRAKEVLTKGQQDHIDSFMYGMQQLQKYKEEADMIKGQGEVEQHGEGGVRESSKGRGRFDLLPYEALEALAKWLEAGAEKYGDRNWEEGLSVKDCINRMVRHATKAANGWTDEDHLAATMCNAAMAITIMQRKPEFDDHKWCE